MVGGERHARYVREMHHRRVYLFDKAEVELVDPVYNPEFCSNCHRIRVTHKGESKGCLNRNDDLVPTRGLDDTALRAAFRSVITTRLPHDGGYITEFPVRDARGAAADGLALPNRTRNRLGSAGFALPR